MPLQKLLSRHSLEATKNRRDVPARFTLTLAGHQRRDVSSKAIRSGGQTFVEASDSSHRAGAYPEIATHPETTVASVGRRPDVSGLRALC